MMNSLPAATASTSGSLSSSSDSSKLSKEDGKHHAKSLAREGWLFKISKKKKKKEKKYFRIVGSTLSWTQQPTDLVPLRSIPLVSASFKGQSPTDFTLLATKLGKEKEYVLSGVDNDDTKNWIAAIRTAMGDTSLKCGWLSMDKKRYWFLLQKGVLYWFAREQDPGADFRRNVLGCMRMLSCQLRVHDDELNWDVADSLAATPEDAMPAASPLASAVSPRASSRGTTAGAPGDVGGTRSKDAVVHGFSAKNREEKQAWVAAFQRQLDKNQRATALGLRRFGWLKHKKQGKKFFVLLDKGRMSWFRGPKEHEERGHVLLDEMAVRRELGEKIPSFTVYAPQQAALTHTWSTETDDELSRWMAVLEKATEHASRKRSNIADEVRSSAVSKRERVEKSGWLVLKGKKKFFVLKGEVLMWFDDEPREGGDKVAKMEGNIRLKDGKLTRQEFSFSIKTSDSKLYQLQAHTKREINEWVASITAALTQARGIAYAQSKGTAVDPNLMSMFSADLGKQGWVIQEGKRRFLDLGVGRLTELDMQFRPRRVIPLEGCSVSAIDNTSFLVRSVTNSYVYECPREETKEWVNNISYYIIKANAGADSSLEKKGWLLVNGKSQWCALRQSKLYWFPQEQTDAFPETKNSLNMLECKLTVLPANEERRPRFEIVPPKGKRYEFVVDSEIDMNDWMNAIVMVRDAQKAATTPQMNVFGARLTDVLAHERAAGRRVTDVPYVVRICVDYLSTPKHMETIGLFQTPGNFAKVREYTATINAGQDLSLKEASAHDVAQLLKQFLRQLPVPVVPVEVQEPMLEARTDADALRKLVHGLPPEHFALLRVLVRLLHDIATQSSKDAVDLSMTFAPLILRPPVKGTISPATAPTPAPAGENASADESDLGLLKSVLALGTLISKFDEVFENKPAVTPARPPARRLSAGAIPTNGGQTLARAISMTNLDKLLTNFLKDDKQTGENLAHARESTMQAYGLDFTSKEEMRQTLVRKQLTTAADPLVDNWHQELKSISDTQRERANIGKRKGIPAEFLKQAQLSKNARSSAIFLLDNLWSELQKKPEAMPGPPTDAPPAPPAAADAVKPSAAPAPSSGFSYPVPKKRPEGPPETQLTLRTQKAVNELDSLFDELEADRTSRGSSAGDASRPEDEMRAKLLDDLQFEKATLRRTKGMAPVLDVIMKELRDEKTRRQSFVTPASPSAGPTSAMSIAAGLAAASAPIGSATSSAESTAAPLSPSGSASSLNNSSQLSGSGKLSNTPPDPSSPVAGERKHRRSHSSGNSLRVSSTDVVSPRVDKKEKKDKEKKEKKSGDSARKSHVDVASSNNATGTSPRVLHASLRTTAAERASLSAASTPLTLSTSGGSGRSAQAGDTAAAPSITPSNSDELIRKTAEEDAKRKEEEAAKRKTDEEFKRKQAEEDAKRKQAADEEAKRRSEEEAKRKAEEDKRKHDEWLRQIEEEARKKVADEMAAKRADEEAKRKADEEAAARKRAADNDAKRAFDAEAARKAAEAEVLRSVGGRATRQRDEPAPAFVYAARKHSNPTAPEPAPAPATRPRKVSDADKAGGSFGLKMVSADIEEVTLVRPGPPSNTLQVPGSAPSTSAATTPAVSASTSGRLAPLSAVEETIETLILPPPVRSPALSPRGSLSTSASSSTSSGSAAPPAAVAEGTYPAVLHVKVNNVTKAVAITPTLTFADVLKTIAKSKAEEYEITSCETGVTLAGLVGSYFQGKSEAKVIMQRSELDL